MAAHDDLMLVITTLLGAMENMVDCKKEIRSLAEEVKTVTADIKSMSKEIKDIKKKVAVIEERVSHDKLPSKMEAVDLKEEITRILEPVDRIPKVEKKLTSLICNINTLRGSLGIWSSKKCVEGKCHTYRGGERENNNSYDLDTRDLPVGTILGVKRWSNGDVSFLINGEDKGVAFRNVPVGVFAFFEGNGYIMKFSILS